MALTGLSAQLGLPQAIPTRPGGLPGRPTHVARAPRARAPMGVLLGVGLLNMSPFWTLMRGQVGVSEFQL